MEKTYAGYEYLIAYKITVPIYDLTVEFCDKWVSKYSRTTDQTCSPSLRLLIDKLTQQINTIYSLMALFNQSSCSLRRGGRVVQAGRSGMTNIPEGYKQESLKGLIKLTGVARGSLEELLKDYLSFARQHKIPIWPKEKANSEIWEINEIWRILKKTPTLPDSPNFPALPDSQEVAVNLMITLIKQANYLIDNLIRSLEEKFVREGGFSENLLKKRLAERNKK